VTAATHGHAHASVIIPAHDEASVIARTLAPLAPAASRGELEVIVVCNGCHDDTARIAASVPGVTVLETEVPSKTTALNLGDRHATVWPRIYLDADIVASEQTLHAVATWLTLSGSLAARPSAVYRTESASWPVRAYYRARSRMPSLNSAIWGAGVYALSRAGHERLGSFPHITGDDLWVDRLFGEAEKAIITGAPVVVRTPQSLSALVKVSRRAVRGENEAGPTGAHTSTTAGTVRELARSVRGPYSAFDAIIYAAVAALARSGSRTATRWERDDSSR
jgi:glycosyltransferase involved in cell wall biosynthesis